MTKKHFEIIANDFNNRAIKVINTESSYEEKWYGLFTLGNLVIDFVNSFNKLNNNFDDSKFIQACGVSKLKRELEREQAYKIASGI